MRSLLLSVALVTLAACDDTHQAAPYDAVEISNTGEAA
jgi:hypothetical protein